MRTKIDAPPPPERLALDARRGAGREEEHGAPRRRPTEVAGDGVDLTAQPVRDVLVGECHLWSGGPLDARVDHAPATEWPEGRVGGLLDAVGGRLVGARGAVGRGVHAGGEAHRRRGGDVKTILPGGNGGGGAPATSRVARRGRRRRRARCRDRRSVTTLWSCRPRAQHAWTLRACDRGRRHPCQLQRTTPPRGIRSRRVRAASV